MVLTSIIYSFTETLVIFFFVGTGVSVKEYTHDHQADPQYHQRSIAIKHRVYPPLMLNLLIMIILFVLAGAADTRRVPMGLYQLIFMGCLTHYVKTKIIQHHCFRDNTRIILDMAGV
jgi:amino acid permease